MCGAFCQLSGLPRPYRTMTITQRLLLFFVILMLGMAVLACVTLRSPDTPAPTQRPTLVPTATMTPTLKPIPLGG